MLRSRMSGGAFPGLGRSPFSGDALHSHQRLYKALDNASSSFEAGNYLNTVGFASFPTPQNCLGPWNESVLNWHRVHSMTLIAGAETLDFWTELWSSRWPMLISQLLDLTKPMLEVLTALWEQKQTSRVCFRPIFPVMFARNSNDSNFWMIG